MRFFAATTLRNGPVDLLPHWLTHYLAMGVDQIALCVVRESMDEQCDQIARSIAGLPVSIHGFSDWTDLRQEEVMRQALDEVGCGPRDWVIHADLDEFNEFPRPINELADLLEGGGHTGLQGHFVDRIEASGRFVAARPNPSLAEQYPIACRLTENILEGDSRKIMLARHEVIVDPGHHTANARSMERGRQYRVHHFKWRQGVLERLEWTLANVARSDSSWGRETARFIELVKPHGCIPMNDPRLEVARNGANAPVILPRTDRGVLAQECRLSNQSFSCSAGEFR